MTESFISVEIWIFLIVKKYVFKSKNIDIMSKKYYLIGSH